MLVDERDRAVAWAEGSDLLAVLDELDPDALPDRGVRLLGLDADLLQNDSTALGGALQGIGLLAESAFAVWLCGPVPVSVPPLLIP